MSGFVTELVVFFGKITSPQYLLMPKMLINFVIAIGTILNPYLLSMSPQMFYGYQCLLLDISQTIYWVFWLLWWLGGDHGIQTLISYLRSAPIRQDYNFLGISKSYTRLCCTKHKHIGTQQILRNK